MAEIPLSLIEASQAIRSGSLTSVELTQATIERADRIDPLIGTYLARFDESALASAEKADADFAAGIDVGPLQGIPVGVKDIIAAIEGPTTAQSLVLDRSWGAGKDAPVVKRLRKAGAVITGKVTTMEFACGMPDATKPFPIPKNPWNTDTWPGGSSSGTGSGVAAGLFLAGLGTDTAGSIRIPAAFCGITGLMPTFGRVPKSGCAPLGYSLDHIGPMARSAADCAAVLQILSGYDPSDPNCIDQPVPDFSATLDRSLKGIRIGVDLENHRPEYADPSTEAVFSASIDALRECGATIVEVTLPHYDEMSAIDMLTMFSEALSYHMVDIRSRWNDYFSATRSMLGMGSLLSGADFVQAQRVRRFIQKELDEMFTTVDVIATPTSSIPSPSYEMLNATEGVDIEGMFKLIHTAYWDPTGLPVLAAPAGFNEVGMPLSLQLAGRPFEEALLLNVANVYQQVSDWHRQVPPLVEMSVAV